MTGPVPPGASVAAASDASAALTGASHARASLSGASDASAALTGASHARASLTGATRRRALEELASEPFDVIVVGGGVTGAGVALDAASRGLRTALVESVDLASGTSRWSSKLAHGGLRYLAKADLGVAWESVVERGRLMTTIAPHLARPMPYLLPLDASTPPVMGRLADVGIHLADGLRMAARTSGRLLPMPRRIDARTASLLAPGLRTDGLRGAVLYYDGWLEDDARLVVALARTAAAHGARVITHCRAESVTERSATLVDELTGDRLEARGLVVNATGVWAGDLEPTLHVRPSRGSHLVVRSEVLGSPKAVVTVPVPGHFGRYVFAIPHPDGLTFVGLTDDEAAGVDGHAPPVPEEDVDFLLSVFSFALAVPIARSDVVGTFAGLRPLVGPTDGSSTADVSRRHLLVDEPGRPVTIAGGKLTAYRRMAQDTVDAVARRLDRPDARCRTRTLPLVGAARPAVLAKVDAPERLVRRYGTEAPRLVALAAEHPDLAGPLTDTCPVTGVEILFGALHEGALTVADLVERRVRAGFFGHEALAAARTVAERALAIAGAPEAMSATAKARSRGIPMA